MESAVVHFHTLPLNRPLLPDHFAHVYLMDYPIALVRHPLPTRRAGVPSLPMDKVHIIPKGYLVAEGLWADVTFYLGPSPPVNLGNVLLQETLRRVHIVALGTDFDRRWGARPVVKMLN